MNIYDFDKTIYDGDSTFNFLIFCFKKHPSIIFTVPKTLCAFFKFYIMKKGTKTQAKEVMYKFLGRIDYKNDVEEFWDKNIHKIKGWYKKQQKDDDIIISASPEFLLKKPCEILGIKYLIASRVNPNNGKYTGKNCHGEEKVRRLYENFPCDIVVDEFYSDSLSDTPLAKLAKKSYLVNKNEFKDWKNI